jgi:transposase
LLEAGRDEEFIEKDTGVSDRTIRRWKMELERTGRIGKPPESRTGRHRVLNAEVETVSTTFVVRGLSARAGELMRTVAGAVRAC